MAGVLIPAVVAFLGLFIYPSFRSLTLGRLLSCSLLLIEVDLIPQCLVMTVSTRSREQGGKTWAETAGTGDRHGAWGLGGTAGNVIAYTGTIALLLLCPCVAIYLCALPSTSNSIAVGAKRPGLKMLRDCYCCLLQVVHTDPIRRINTRILRICQIWWDWRPILCLA